MLNELCCCVSSPAGCCVELSTILYTSLLLWKQLRQRKRSQRTTKGECSTGTGRTPDSTGCRSVSTVPTWSPAWPRWCRDLSSRVRPVHLPVAGNRQKPVLILISGILLQRHTRDMWMKMDVFTERIWIWRIEWRKISLKLFLAKNSCELWCTCWDTLRWFPF